MNRVTPSCWLNALSAWVKVGDNASRMPGAPEGLDRRARPVRGQLQGGSAGKLLLPVGKLRLQHSRPGATAAASGQSPHTGWRAQERGGSPGGEGFIEHLQFPPEHSLRPAVGDDVVHRQEQHMLLAARRKRWSRTNGPCARSKGRWASSRASIRTRASRSRSAIPADPLPGGVVDAGLMTCCGCPSM